MYVVARQGQEQHFSEGEPDLEPPEELAVGEVDDDILLEEDLDSEAVLEQDVDEDVLEVTLEDLAHATDDDDTPQGPEQPMGSAHDLEELDVDALDIADVEESLDRILGERLAEVDVAMYDDIDDAESADADVGDEDAEGDGGHTVTDHGRRPTRRRSGLLVEELEVAPCRAGEFVCRGCFLVRSQAQLADAAAPLCRDCAG